MVNEIETYSKLLRLRDTAKKIQQLSWTISQIEKEFPLDKLSKKQHPELVRAYLRLVSRIKIILHELQEEENKQ